MIGTGPDQIPSPLLSFGLRTVDGSCNNLSPVRTVRRRRPGLPAPDDAGVQDRRGRIRRSSARPRARRRTRRPAAASSTAQPRTISQPDRRPDLDEPGRHRRGRLPGPHAGLGVGRRAVRSSAPEYPVGCVPEHETLFIENITTDVGLSPPFNSLFTIFGQFFDHGLDKITNGGNGTVFVPLKDDDPLVAGPDHIFGNGDDLPAEPAVHDPTRGNDRDRRRRLPQRDRTPTRRSSTRARPTPRTPRTRSSSAST